jgi:mannan endo-1,4-beta-mannosidase
MHDIKPSNPHATEEARELLAFLYGISGTATMCGQHNFPNHGSRYSDEAGVIAGKYPALWGQDFGFSGGDDKDSVLARQAVIDEAKRQHAAGSVITLMWHAVRPTEDEPVTFLESIQGKVTDLEWSDLITPGTQVHERWAHQVDTIAPYLAQLQDASIPVIWRPYHEMNGAWFWWGAKPGLSGYAALYRQLFERLAGFHGLNNLIWVYNADRPSATVLPFEACFPGHDVVDVLALDVYANDFDSRYYDDLVDLAAGKPVALGEVGTAPTLDVLEAQPLWTWFMIWTDHLTSHNKPEAIKTLYNSRRMLTRPVDLKSFRA